MSIESVIVSIVVPFVSIFVSAWLGTLLAERSAWKQSATSLFVKINEDIQTYYQEYTRLYTKAREGSLSDGLEAMRPLQSAITALNVNVLTLGLLFGKERSKPLGSRLQNLIRLGHKLIQEDPGVSPDDVGNHFTALFKEIGRESQSLWENEVTAGLVGRLRRKWTETDIPKLTNEAAESQGP